MVSLEEGAREFVGFVWFDGDWLGSQEGILVEASDVREARHIVEEFFGPSVGISLWSEEDAGRPRSIPWDRLRAGGGDAGRVGEDLEMLLFTEGAEDDGATIVLEDPTANE